MDDLFRKVEISFVFPDGSVREIKLSHMDVGNILRDKPLEQDIYVDTYKIDWWVYGALQHLELPFVVETKGRTGYWESTITKIGDHASGSEGKWVYYVNGLKSKYHISTQLDRGIKHITFVYEKAR